MFRPSVTVMIMRLFVSCQMVALLTYDMPHLVVYTCNPLMSKFDATLLPLVLVATKTISSFLI